MAAATRNLRFGEPLLALYDRHGVDFLGKVRGMFALALHDRVAARAVLGPVRRYSDQERRYADVAEAAGRSGGDASHASSRQ